MLHMDAADKISHRQIVDVVFGTVDGVLDLGCQLFVNPFVGVGFQDPFAPAGINAKITAIPLDLPGTFDHLIGIYIGNSLGAIRAAIQHHHQFIGEGQTFEAVVQDFFFVVDNDQSG